MSLSRRFLLMAFSCCLLALSLTLTLTASQVDGQVMLAQATVRGDYSHPDVKGTWSFGLGPSDTLVTINITLTGLPAGTYGTHIHTYGDITTGNTIDSQTILTTSAGVGSHFNPYGTAHNCYPNSTRHVGDIGNLDVTGPENNTQIFSFQRDLITLGGGSSVTIASIIGRGVILHSGIDHCYAQQPAGASGTPLAQGVVGIVDPAPRGMAGPNTAFQGLSINPNSLVGVFHSTPASGTNIVGTIQMASDSSTTNVRVLLNVQGLAPNTTHGFHIHIYGDDSDSTGTIAGGHYNPGNAAHALPPTNPRHMGDMGNFHTDMNGVGYFDGEFDLIQLIPAASTPNVIGRGVVIHALADDGTGATGNAGSRLAVAVLGISNNVLPPVQTSSSSSTGSGTPTPGTPTGDTICDRLTTAQGYTLTDTNSYTALQNLVTRAIKGATASMTQSGVAVTGIYNNPLTAPYFNGQYQTRYVGDPASTITPGANAYVSPDFGHSSTDFMNLLVRLAQFLGQSQLLDCSTNVPAYDGSTNLFAVHSHMNITHDIFGAFNQELVTALSSYGLSSTDRDAFANVLVALFGQDNLHASRPNEICQLPGCPCASSVTGTNCDTDSGLSGSTQLHVSFITLIGVIVLTVCGIQQYW